MGRAFVLRSVLLCWLCFESNARAQHDEQATPAKPAAELHWVRLPGAEDCIAGDALARAVEARLRRPVFDTRVPAAVLIEGYAQRGASGHRAQLSVRARDGTLLGSRELESSAGDCRELSETVTVVLAIMIDPEAASRSKAPPAREPTRVVSPAEPRHRLSAFASGGIGLLPKFAIGLGAAYELKLGAWGGLRAQGVGYFGQRAALESAFPDSPSAGAFLRLAYGGLAYCPLWWSPGRTTLLGCVGSELGAIASEGYGLSPDQEQRTFWGAASAAARLSVVLMGPLTAQLGASLLVPYAPVHFQATRGGQEPLDVFEQPPVASVFELGLGVQFAP